MDIKNLRQNILNRWAKTDIQFVGLKSRDVAIDKFLETKPNNNTLYPCEGCKIINPNIKNCYECLASAFDAERGYEVKFLNEF